MVSSCFIRPSQVRCGLIKWYHSLSEMVGKLVWLDLNYIYSIDLVRRVMFRFNLSQRSQSICVLREKAPPPDSILLYGYSIRIVRVVLSCRLKIAFIRLFSHRRCGCEREARKKWLCKKEQFLEQHSNHLKPILDFIQPWLHCHAGWGRPLVTLLSKASFWGPFLCYFPWTWEDPQVSCWNVLHISDSILAQQMLSTQVLSL
jgi:hypothetical protein